MSQFNGESHLSELFPLLAHYTHEQQYNIKSSDVDSIFSKIWSQEITLKNCIVNVLLVYIVVSTSISSEKTQLFSITVKFLGSRGFCDDPFIVPDLSVIIAIIAFLLQLKMQ